MIYLLISVAGFSIEFASMNPVGFFFYSFYSIYGYVYPNNEAGTVIYKHLI